MLAVISTYGWVHTLVSLSAIGFGLWAFIRYGKIDTKQTSGRWYLGTMLFGSITAFGFFSHGFTPGHVLSLVTLALLGAGFFATRGHWTGGAGEYIQAVSFSASYLLLMVFTTTETLTRVPADKPFASGPTDPALLPVRLVLLVTFLAGVAYQVLAIRRSRRALEPIVTGSQPTAVLGS